MEDLRYQEVIERLSALKTAIGWLRPPDDEPSGGGQVTSRDVMILVCQTYGLKQRELVSHRRARHIVWPRHIAMYLCYNLTRHSLPSVGVVFGGFDHTTVLHARARIARLRQEKPEVDAELRGLESKLGQG